MTQFFKQTGSELEEFLDFMEEDLENVRRVVKYCRENGIETDFIVHGKGETVEESSEKTGVDPESVVKTLVFMGEDPVAVLCPGDKRVDEEKLSDILGCSVRMAYPREVEEATGYKVGGVSPFDLDIPVFMEESVLENDLVKPAAGSRVVGVRVSPEDLTSPETKTVDVTK